MGALLCLNFLWNVAEESWENETESFLYLLLSPFLLDKPIISTHSVKNTALKKVRGKHIWFLGDYEISI